jgi:peptide subunit release factor 1 (eRF1)
MKVAQQVERERGENLVHSAITAAAKGREGVLELNDTLGAARAGRVHTLLISDGFRAPGYRCQVCDNLSVEHLDACPFCGGEIEKVQDAVEWVVRKVIRDGGEVEVLHESEALEQAGNIAGLLRY